MKAQGMVQGTAQMKTACRPTMIELAVYAEG